MPWSRPRDELEAAAFIRANLPLSAVPGLPALRLHRAGPDSGLSRILASGAHRRAGSPYWAYPWAGGLALAHYLFDRPATVGHRQVLDLGAGSGLVAIAAARAGARAVLAAETDPLGGVAIPLNAAANGVHVTIMPEDLLDGPPLPVDVVLVGDLFYDPALAERVTAFLDRCVAAGLEVLVGDPGRLPLPRTRLEPLASYVVPDVGDPLAAASATATVYRFGAAAPVRPPP